MSTVYKLQQHKHQRITHVLEHVQLQCVSLMHVHVKINRPHSSQSSLESADVHLSEEEGHSMLTVVAGRCLCIDYCCSAEAGRDASGQLCAATP